VSIDSAASGVVFHVAPGLEHAVDESIPPIRNRVPDYIPPKAK
jgi:hypothetical protein